MEQTSTCKQNNDDPFSAPKSKREMVSELNVPSAELNDKKNPKTNELVEKVFRIPVIWDQIADYLRPLDLARCRLVNTSWESIVSSILLKRDWCVVQFTYNIFEERYIHGSNRSSSSSSTNVQNHRGRRHRGQSNNKESKTLNQLISCLNHSTINNNNFPSTHFRFVGGQMEDIELQTFFSLHGPIIKTLSMHLDLDNEDSFKTIDLDSLWNLLTCQAPNIHTLDLSDFIGTETKDKNNSSIVLPSLKKLILETKSNSSASYISFVQKLAISSPNLENVENFSCLYIDGFLTANKMGTIKEYNFEYNKQLQRDCEPLLKFARSGPRLHRLTWLYSMHLASHLWSSKTKENYLLTLNMLLESSKDTLQILEIQPLGFLESKLVFPIFKNLKKLHALDLVVKDSFDEEDEDDDEGGPYHDDDDDVLNDQRQDSLHWNGTLVPQGISWNNQFPNLKIFGATLHDDFRNYSDPNCPADQHNVGGQLTGVNCLELVLGYSAIETHRVIRRLFPNVIKIILDFTAGDLTSQFGQKVQDIVSVYGDNLQEFVFRYTPVRVCDTVMHFWTTFLLAMGDLKNLRRLKIVVENGGSSHPAHFIFFWPEHLTHLLHDLPHLKVTVAYHQHCPSAAVVAKELLPLQPYIDVIHDAGNQRKLAYHYKYQRQR